MIKFYKINNRIIYSESDNAFENSKPISDFNIFDYDDLHILKDKKNTRDEVLARNHITSFKILIQVYYLNTLKKIKLSKMVWKYVCDKVNELIKIIPNVFNNIPNFYQELINDGLVIK